MRQACGRAAAWIIDLYHYRWIVERVFRALKSQGLDLEDGYARERLPRPLTFARGLRQFHAIAQGLHLAAATPNEPP